MFDYLIVGCGLFGVSFARTVTDAGKSCLIVDKRDHIAGNCHTKSLEGIRVHAYGPHQFHTKSKRIWDFVNRFAEFNHYRAHIKANHGGKMYSMPPNMRLFNRLWGVTTPDEAKKKIESVRVPFAHPANFKEWVLDQVGEDIYEKFYKGYTTKQWGRDPSEIPVSTARRLPIRFTWNDRWFDDQYEGIPIGGYTAMVERMLLDIPFQLEVDYFEHKRELDRVAKKIVYTGKVDELFDYRFGELGYRSIRFEEEVHDTEDLQGNSIINYTDASVPYTRIVEHKHFEFLRSDKTVITKEYPEDYSRGKIPYYPIGDAANREMYRKYWEELARHPHLICGGRLGEYKYYNMDQVIASAIKKAETEIES